MKLDFLAYKSILFASFPFWRHITLCQSHHSNGMVYTKELPSDPLLLTNILKAKIKTYKNRQKKTFERINSLVTLDFLD